MKAAILEKLGDKPIYGNIKDPVPHNDDQVVIDVKAAALKNLDKLKTYPEYYAPYQTLPVVVGTDCVGSLPDGTKVYAHGITGTMAEKTVINSNRYTILPDNLDLAVAAALPNAILGSVVPLIIRANMKPGQNILINGATGITGKIAVQVAKHYGAAKVIATGRNENSLLRLKSLGANEIISLYEKDESIISKLKKIDNETPIDIVLDYLWGKPAEIILQSLKNKPNRNIAFVTVGDMAGSNIPLSSGLLRSADITLLGSGFGSLNQEVLNRLMTEFLPHCFSLAANNKLYIETENYSLKEISTAWDSRTNGKRIVITLD